MIKVKATVVCDECAAIVAVDVNLATGKPCVVPLGWRCARFRPGVLRNKEARPDRHFCSKACWDKAKASETLVDSSS